MASYSSVACAEVHGTQQENWGTDGFSASVVLQCAWNLRHALMADLLAYARAWPHGSFTDPPRARTCSCVPDGAAFSEDGQAVNYTYDALVTVNYSTSSPETKDDQLVSESLEPNAEFLRLDFRRFRWGSQTGDPILEDEAPGKLLKSLNLVRTHYQVAGPLPTALLSLIGSTNNAAYTSTLVDLTFEQDTLLYNPPSLSRTITTGGAKAWTIRMKFSHKPQGWNKFWRSKTQSYESIYEVGSASAYENYPQNNFSAFLF